MKDFQNILIKKFGERIRGILDQIESRCCSESHVGVCRFFKNNLIIPAKREKCRFGCLLYLKRLNNPISINKCKYFSPLSGYLEELLSKVPIEKKIVDDVKCPECKEKLEGNLGIYLTTLTHKLIIYEDDKGERCLVKKEILHTPVKETVVCLTCGCNKIKVTIHGYIVERYKIGKDEKENE